MFKQLLSNNRIFGAILCVVVFVAGGLLYLNAVKRQAARDIQRTQETVKQLQTPKTPKTEVQPQNPIVSETEQGHIHADGTFHAEPHAPKEPPAVLPSPPDVSSAPSPPRGDVALETLDGFVINSSFAAAYPPAGVGPDWASMPPESLATAIEAIETHRLDAPEGYDYRRTSEGKAILDDNGYPVLHKRGEPFFSIRWVQDFRPTPEQYAEYKKLSKQYSEIRAQTVSSPELDRLSAQMDEMRRTYVGEMPLITDTFSVPAGTDMDAFHRRSAERASLIRHDALRKAGLGYLLD